MTTFLEHAHILDATLFVQIQKNQVFAAAALYRKPGILSVFNALLDCSNGTLKIVPPRFYQFEQN